MWLYFMERRRNPHPNPPPEYMGRGKEGQAATKSLGHARTSAFGILYSPFPSYNPVHGICQSRKNRFESLANLHSVCMSFMACRREGRISGTLPEEQSRPFIKQAVEAGINFFDTANVYSDGTSEEIVGKALRELFAPG